MSNDATNSRDGIATKDNSQARLLFRSLLLVSLVAGWLAGQIVQGTGFWMVGGLVIGIHSAFGIVGAIINATIGALVQALVADIGQEPTRLGETAYIPMAARLISSAGLVSKTIQTPSHPSA